MFQTKLFEEIKTHFKFSNFLRKSFRLWDNVGKCGRARRSTDVSVTLCMCFACWI